MQFVSDIGWLLRWLLTCFWHPAFSLIASSWRYILLVTVNRFTQYEQKFALHCASHKQHEPAQIYFSAIVLLWSPSNARLLVCFCASGHPTAGKYLQCNCGVMLIRNCSTPAIRVLCKFNLRLLSIYSSMVFASSF